MDVGFGFGNVADAKSAAGLRHHLHQANRTDAAVGALVERVAAARIGQEPVRYVRNIYKYYVAYKLIEEADAATKAAIAAATTQPAAAGTSAPPQPAKPR